MGFFDNIDKVQLIEQSKREKQSLESKATNLLKKNFKKTRRGSGIKKKTRKQKEHARLLKQYQLQKKQRGEMFKEFERLIGE
jgi:hypothetical protein